MRRAQTLTRHAHPSELRGLLRATLLEESHEVADARDVASTAEELADVLEVVHALAAVHGARGAILLLEDVNEEEYRLDRLLTQLVRAGWFDGAAGVVAGSWQSCGPGADEVLRERLAPSACRSWRVSMRATAHGN